MSNSIYFKLPDGTVAVGVVPLDPITGNPSTGAQYTSWSGDSIELGQVSGVVPINVGGVKTSLTQNVATALEEVATNSQPGAAGVAMNIVSSNAADIGEQVRVSALGANFVKLAPFTVTLNGTTPVPLPGGPFTRINALSRLSGDFAGTVSVVNGANVYGGIAAGGQAMRSSLYTVPAGHKLFVSDLIGSLAKDTGATVAVIFSLQGKPVASSGYGGVITFATERDGNSATGLSQHLASGFTGPFDLRVVGLTAGAGVDAQGFYSGKLVDLSVFPNA